MSIRHIKLVKWSIRVVKVKNICYIDSKSIICLEVRRNQTMSMCGPENGSLWLQKEDRNKTRVHGAICPGIGVFFVVF